MYVAFRAVGFLFVILAFTGCDSEVDMAFHEISVNEEGLAVGGYDLVSYRSGQPQPGNADYSYTWRGATFLFANQAHREQFAAMPERYLPEYGGYCAFGMGLGQLAQADPTAFVIQNDKLYLNASQMVRRFWLWFGNPEKSASKWQALKTAEGV